MKIPLSSSITYFWKYIFPTIWFILFLIVSIIEISIMGFFYYIPILILGVICSYFIFSYAIPSKKVMIDDDFLYVDNFKKTLKIPITKIKYSSDNFFIQPRTITIYLKEECEFGDKIKFIAFTEYFLFWTEHTANKYIKEKIKNIKN